MTRIVTRSLHIGRLLVLYTERYSMNHGERGVCLIINNHKFLPSTGFGDRDGTYIDEENLNRNFQELGFDVRSHNDVSRSQLVQILMGLAKEDHTHRDVLAVIILSHGVDDGIWMIDYKIPHETIFSHFKAANCPSLAGKPKLFFIQACRGSRYDAGTLERFTKRDVSAPKVDADPDRRRNKRHASTPKVDADPDRRRNKRHASTPKVDADTERRRNKRHASTPKVDAGSTHQRTRTKRVGTAPRIPNEADFMVAYSVVPGFYSWRSADYGSWFGQTIGIIFDHYAYNTDVLTMMTRVSRVIGTRASSTSDPRTNDKKQQVQIRTTLTKEVFLQ